jgi:osmoprotectant transport system permease protein
MAGGGPVIPNFGGASECVTNNDLFCTDWVQKNWSGTLQPALLDHLKLTLIAVAIGFVIAFCTRSRASPCSRCSSPSRA